MVIDLAVLIGLYVISWYQYTFWKYDINHRHVFKSVDKYIYSLPIQPVLLAMMVASAFELGTLMVVFVLCYVFVQMVFYVFRLFRVWLSLIASTSLLVVLALKKNWYEPVLDYMTGFDYGYSLSTINTAFWLAIVLLIFFQGLYTIVLYFMARMTCPRKVELFLDPKTSLFKKLMRDIRRLTHQCTMVGLLMIPTIPLFFVFTKLDDLYLFRFGIVDVFLHNERIHKR